MSEQTTYSSERLLQEWQFRREMVNYYFGSMQRLTQDDQLKDQRWRERNEKLSSELIAYRQADYRLRSSERKTCYKVVLRPAQSLHALIHSIFCGFGAL